MRLRELQNYNRILIQCHDNPDADAISSGYCLYHYFKHLGKDVQLVYSGINEIKKSNLVMMVDLLNIPIRHVTESIQIPDLLITVDCQYGNGNVTKLPAKNIAIIDHHQSDNSTYELKEIRSYLGSCATVVWLLLLEEGFDVNKHKNLATALYYGLFSDTNNFSELYHPSDKDMRDSLEADIDIVRKLKNSNLSLSELELAGIALIRYTYHEDNRFAMIKAQPCDPNILGLISDLVIQVDSIDTCLVYNELNEGYKLSVRSCIREVKASELAHEIVYQYGSGGGHLEKAGGFISKSKLHSMLVSIPIEQYFLDRITGYFNSYDVIDAKDTILDTNDFTRYEKKPIPIGYVKATDILPLNTPFLIRTLETDFDLFVEEDLYIMIGIDGEVYPIRKNKFQNSYTPTDQTLDIMAQYVPSIKSKINGKVYDILSYAKPCIATGQTLIYAKPIEKITKVFTAWDPNRYMYGKVGDYLAVRCDDPHDIYIIDQDIFHRTYASI